MAKAKINANSRAGVALHSPKIFCFDEIISRLKSGTIVDVNFEDVEYDILGEKLYFGVKLDSGKEGYVLSEALEEM